MVFCDDLFDLRHKVPADLGIEQRLGRDLPHGNAVPSCQVAVLRNREIYLIGQKGQALNAGVLYFLRSDHQVIDPLMEEFHRVIALVEIVVYSDLRVGHRKPGRGKPPNALVAEGDGESLDLPGGAEHIGFQLFHVSQDRMHMDERDLPGFVQMDSIRAAVK